MTEIAQETTTTQRWYGCYDGGWQNLIQPEAYAHPAKFSRNLISRIYTYALERGWLKPGDTVLDCFGGVGLGALDAGANGLNWVGVELETRFTDLGQGCDCTGITKADWVRFYGRFEKANYKGGRHWCPDCLAQAQQITESRQLSFFEPEPTAAYVRNSGLIPETFPHRYRGNLDLFRKYAKPGTGAVLLNGDSRQLRRVIGQAGMDGVLSSPPYINSLERPNGIDASKIKRPGGSNSQSVADPRYGVATGQLANLKEGDLDALLTSPPFAGNTGGRGEASRNGINAALFDRHSGGMKRGTGDNPANLDHLPLRGFGDAVVSSPPWEESLDRGTVNRVARTDYARKNGISNAEHISPIDMEKIGQRLQEYGTTAGQLGIETGQTFWQAARAIVTESYLALKPNSYSFWVVKRFVRDGAIVDFTGQWKQLCEACGFEFVEHIEAMLIQSESEQGDLNGGTVKHKKKKASFFRRLHEKKFPHLAIDCEDILVMRKP